MEKLLFLLGFKKVRQKGTTLFADTQMEELPPSLTTLEEF